MSNKKKIGMVAATCFLVAAIGGTTAFASGNLDFQKLEKGTDLKNLGTYATIDEKSNVVVKDQDGKEIALPSDKGLGELQSEGTQAATDSGKDIGVYATIDENGKVVVKDQDGKEIALPSDKDLGELQYEGSAVVANGEVTNGTFNIAK